MSPFDAEFGADVWEPRHRCRETRVIVYPDGVEPCPGCEDCAPDIPDEELRRLREQNDAIYTQAIRSWFQKTEVA